MGAGQSNELERSNSRTSFLKINREALTQQFLKKYPDGKMTKDEFIAELTARGASSEFCEHMYTAFCSGNADMYMIDVNKFISGLHSVANKPTEEKLRIAFRLYDSDGNYQLDQNEVANLVNNIFHVASSGSHQDNNLIVDPVAFFNSLDTNKDGTISEEEFIIGCRQYEPILKSTETCLMSLLAIDAKAKENMQSFGHQAAGHGGEKGLLKDGKTIYKHFSEREFHFYEELKRCDPEIKRFFPEYFGRTRVEKENEELDHYIILEDLTQGMVKPCIMDTKMGTKTFESDAGLTKKGMLMAVDAITTSKNLGFRICGIRSYQKNTNDYVVKNKAWGSSVKAHNMLESLKIFFSNGEAVRYDVVKAMLPFLLDLKKWMETQRQFKFIGSSLLFVYDGASDTPVVNVRMVDFAHTSSNSNKIDEDYLVGLNNLINFFSQIINEEKAGTLKVTVVKGVDLVPKDSNGKSDPYVKLRIGESSSARRGDQVKSTKVIYENLNPYWNEEIIFENVIPSLHKLWIQVYDKDLLSKDDFMGSATVDLATLTVGTPVHMGLKLENVSKGVVEIVLQFNST